MDRWLKLPEIETLSASGAYGGQRSLSSDTCVSLLSALAWMNQAYAWQGSSGDVTDAEWDDIQALTAQAEYELTTEASVTTDYEKVASTSSAADIAYLELTGLDLDDYSQVEIFITGLLSDAVQYPQYDDVIMQFNGATSITSYSTIALYTDYNSLDHLNYNFNTGGIVLARSAPRWYTSESRSGYVNVVIPLPTDYNRKLVTWTGGFNGGYYSSFAVLSGTGEYRGSVDPITRVKIFPNVGNYFKAGASWTKPDRVQMSMYGRK